MIFNPRKFYTHKRMLDCMIYVRGVLPTGSLFVEWWVKRGFSLDVSEVIHIKSEELGNWYEYVTKT